MDRQVGEVLRLRRRTSGASRPNSRPCRRCYRRRGSFRDPPRRGQGRDRRFHHCGLNKSNFKIMWPLNAKLLF